MVSDMKVRPSVSSCSSITSILSLFGQVDYCAANNVLDAFAHELRSRRPETFTVAVNWAAWEEVGMAAAARETGRPLAPGTPVRHPLLDRCLTATPEAAEFVTELRADDHWVLSEHLVLGTPTVPGATWLEIARAAL